MSSPETAVSYTITISKNDGMAIAKEITSAAFYDMVAINNIIYEMKDCLDDADGSIFDVKEVQHE
jgi:hypothetical protein